MTNPSTKEEIIITQESTLQPNQEVKRSSNLLQEFVAFIQKFGVVGLAIGVVVGQAVTNLVTSIVTHLITPTISLLLPKNTEFKNLEIFGTIKIGEFLNSFITFVFIILIVFIASKFMLKYLLSDEEKKTLGI